MGHPESPFPTMVVPRFWGYSPQSALYISRAPLICSISALRLLSRDARRASCIPYTERARSIPSMEITTKSSIRVKPRTFFNELFKKVFCIFFAIYYWVRVGQGAPATSGLVVVLPDDPFEQITQYVSVDTFSIFAHNKYCVALGLPLLPIPSDR